MMHQYNCKGHHFQFPVNSLFSDCLQFSGSIYHWFESIIHRSLTWSNYGHLLHYVLSLQWWKHKTVAAHFKSHRWLIFIMYLSDLMNLQVQSLLLTCSQLAWRLPVFDGPISQIMTITGFVTTAVIVAFASIVCSFDVGRNLYEFLIVVYTVSHPCWHAHLQQEHDLWGLDEMGSIPADVLFFQVFILGLFLECRGSWVVSQLELHILRLVDEPFHMGSHFLLIWKVPPMASCRCSLPHHFYHK